MAHAEQFAIRQGTRAGHDLRQSVRARILPAFLDGLGEVRQQLISLGLAIHRGIFPGDHVIAVFRGQPVQLHEDAEWVEPREVRHRVALALTRKAGDDIGGISLHDGSGLHQSLRAEIRLEDFAVTSVLGWVEGRRKHGHRAAGRLQRQMRREQIRAAQRGQHILAARQVVSAVHEHNRASIPQHLPSGAAVGRHR